MAGIIQAAAAWVWRASWQAAVVLLIVMLIRAVTARKISARMWCFLWILAGARLMLPAIASPVSLFNLREWIGFSSSANALIAPMQPAKSNDAMKVSVVYGPVPGLANAATHSPLQSTAPTKRFSSVNWPVLLGGIWIAGALAMFLRRSIGEWRAARRINSMQAVSDSQIQQVLEQCCRPIGVRRAVKIVQTDRMRSPAVAGVIRPVLILPINFDISASELRMIIMHELAHVRRWDVLIDRLMLLVRDVHWFNPMAWLWVAMYRADREIACDEAVLARLQQDDRPSYGRCLLRVVEMVSNLQPAPATVGIFERNHNLRRRITMISSSNEKRSWFGWMATLMIAMLCATALTDAADKDERKTPTTADTAGNPFTKSRAESDPSILEVTTPKEPKPTDEATKAQLDRKLPEAKFDASGFSDVIDWMRDVTGANIFVNWRALEAAGIDKNTPVTARLRDVKFSKLLQTILADVGGGTTKLGYTIDEGVITISTQEDIGRNVITRVYDVRDLLVDPLADVIPPSTKISQSATQPAAPISQVDQIMQLIQETVDAASWRESGGTVGNIRHLSGQFIITQTPEAHAEIAKLLDQLREVRAVQVVVEGRFIRTSESVLKDAGITLDDLAKDTEKGGMMLDSAKATALRNKIARDKATSVLAAPRLTLFNGQHAKATAGTETAYVSAFTQIRKDGETRFDPKMSTVNSGIILDLTATSSADRKNIVLNMHPQFQELLSIGTEKWQGADAKDLMIQKPVVKTQDATVTVSVPDGMTFVMLLSSGENLNADQPGERTIFLIKPTLIVKREVPAGVGVDRL